MKRFHILASVVFLTACSPRVKPYPLGTCPVSGERLGQMGVPFAFEYQGQEIKLCCKMCKSRFDQDAEAILKKIQKDSRP